MALVLLAGTSLGSVIAARCADAGDLLQLEAKISLGEISGRIDHLAIDLAGSRLFVAELGNGSLGVVDLVAGTARTLPGFDEPQGLAYLASADRLYVADGGDGVLHVLKGDDLAEVSRLELGSDADNVHIDPLRNHIVVGYGDGALAMIDALKATKVGNVELPAHPEGFQIDAAGDRLFVNIPDADEIAVVDLVAGKVEAQWHPADRGNFPMALDPRRNELVVAFRRPAAVASFDLDDGTSTSRLPACEDADDLFIDARRGRLYVVCGAGEVEVFAAGPDGYASIGHVTTAPGARTGLFVPELDRLFVAAPAHAEEPAALLMFRPL